MRNTKLKRRNVVLVTRAILVKRNVLYNHTYIEFKQRKTLKTASKISSINY